MSHAPPQMSKPIGPPNERIREGEYATDAATAETGLPDEFALLHDFPRPMSCQLNGAITEQTTVADLAAMMQAEPLRFALRFMNLEGQVRLIESRLEGLRGAIR